MVIAYRLWVMAMFLFMAGTAQAEHLTPQQALARLSSGSQMKRIAALTANPSTLTPVYTDNKTFYVFNNTDNGFAIVSADDMGPALLGYSDNGSFDENNIPDGLKYWLSQYSRNLEKAIAKGEPLYSSTTSPLKASRTSVAYLIQTKWGQDSIYYTDCPRTQTGKRTVTGCVATALAQVLKYYNNPTQPKGTGSWTITGYKAGTFDFDSYKPDYSLMQNYYYRYTDDNGLTHFAPTTTAEQNAAVAGLMYAAGASVDMIYNSNSSGAVSENLPYALSDIWGFDKSCTYENRDYYTDTEWEELLYSELQAGRPLLFAGLSESDNGHQFICDGYDATEGLYHFNWGWNGTSDGYFAVTGDNPLNPYDQGTGGTETHSAFKYSNGIVAGVKPDAGGKRIPQMILYNQTGEGLTVSKSGTTTAVTKVDQETPLQFNFYSIVNYTFTQALTDYQTGTTTENGESITIDYGARFVDTTSGAEYFTTTAESQTFPFQYGIPTNMTFSTTGVPGGTYRIYPVYKDCNGSFTGWRNVRITTDITIPTVEISEKEPEPKYDSKYDINNDEAVDSLDIQDMRHYLLERTEKLSKGFDEIKCDLNEDGYINIIDLQMLQNYISSK